MVTRSPPGEELDLVTPASPLAPYAAIAAFAASLASSFLILSALAPAFSNCVSTQSQTISEAHWYSPEGSVPFSGSLPTTDPLDAGLS